MSSCKELSTSKYVSRPSPPYSASSCKEGTVKIGNDGNKYIVKSNRWVKYNSSNVKSSPKKSSKRSSPKKSSSKRSSPKKSSKKSSPKKSSKKSSPKRSSERSSPKRSSERSSPKRSSERSSVRPVSKSKFAAMLAKNYDPKIDPTGWWHSEKLDGVRAAWLGNEFVSRNNKIFRSPQTFKKYFPKDDVLDGELFTKRGDFKGTISIVSHKTPNEKDWKKINYMAFDLPHDNGKFEDRMKRLKSIVSRSCRGKRDCPIKVVKQTKIKNRSHLSQLHKSITKNRGEGSMLRRPGSPYENKRSSSLLKLKDILEDDAVVVSHEKGSGKYSSMLGKLVVKWKKGKHKGVQFKVGSGLTDNERKNPNKFYPIGKTVNIQFTEIQSSGKPRFPVLRGAHVDR
jgi:DNA ligase 1